MSPAFNLQRGWERPTYSLPSRRRNRDYVVSNSQAIDELCDIKRDRGNARVRVLEVEDDALSVVEDVVDVGGVEGGESRGDLSLGQDLLGERYISHED